MALLPGVHAQPGALLPAITTTSLRHQRRKRRGSSWDWRSNPKHQKIRCLPSTSDLVEYIDRTRQVSHLSYVFQILTDLSLSQARRGKRF